MSAKWADVPNDANWAKDINNMHLKFGVHDWVKTRIEAGDYYSLHEFLQFRIRFLDEELHETKEAIKEIGNFINK